MVRQIFLQMILLFVLSVTFIPVQVYSAPIVPCDGVIVKCEACLVVQLGQNILDWTIGVMASIIALVFALGGMRMVMSAGDTHAVTEARGMMTNAVIGFVILLSAWLVVDTVLKLVISDDVDVKAKLGVWNTVECIVQPTYVPLVEGTSRPVVGGGTAGTLTPAQKSSRLSSTAAYRNQLCSAATAEGIANQCDSLQALVGIESSGKVNAVSPVGAMGLMQIMPGTARDLDPSLSGLSDLEVRIRLEDPEFNIQLGTKLYSNLYTQYNGNLPKVYAAYNGGTGANLPSENCSGQLRWQCEWDNDAHTIPNTGYAETRNYVRNVNALRCSIPGAQGC